MSQAISNPAALVEVLENILSDIGTVANSLNTGLVDLNCNPEDAGRGYAHMYSMLAERIGWLADLGMTHISGAPEIWGDAEQWFMSPAYKEAKAKLEAEGGKS